MPSPTLAECKRKLDEVPAEAWGAAPSVPAPPAPDSDPGDEDNGPIDLDAFHAARKRLLTGDASARADVDRIAARLAQRSEEMREVVATELAQLKRQLARHAVDAHAATRLTPGLYRLHWRAGGSSLAAVGRCQDGSRWFAPCDWVTGQVSSEWHLVSSAEPIQT